MKSADILVANEIFATHSFTGNSLDIAINQGAINEMLYDIVYILNLKSIELVTSRLTYGYCFRLQRDKNNYFLFNDLVHDLFFYFLMADD